MYVSIGWIAAEKKPRKTGKQVNSDVIGAMPKSLRESLNVSASVDLKSAKLFVAPASRM